MDAVFLAQESFRLKSKGLKVHRQRPGKNKKTKHTHTNTLSNMGHLLNCIEMPLQAFLSLNMNEGMARLNEVKEHKHLATCSVWTYSRRQMGDGGRGGCYFRGAPAMSSSFKVNFFRRASEIRVAESSSLSEEQPLLNLRRNQTRDQSFTPSIFNHI